MTQSKQGEVMGTINHMKKKGSFKLIVIALAIGFTLLIIGGLELFDDNEQGRADSIDGDKYESFYEYKEELEREIRFMCESISGVEAVSVVAFFDGVGESVYAQNTQSGTSERNEYVIIGSGSSSHALYLGEALPEISGIGVICKTGGQEDIRSELSALLAATYGLSMTRIYVAEAK